MQRVVSSFISCAPYTSALQRTFYEAIYSPQYALILYAVFVKGSVYCDAFDPHPDPQREMPVRKQRNKERQTELHTQQKAPKRAGNGSPSALDTLRNQQVVCSSHITSSKNTSKSYDFGVFLRVFGTFRGWAVFADPHRDPHGKMAGKVWRAPNWILHDLRHELPHFLRRFVLGLPCGVGICAESESDIVVAEH